MNSFKIAVNEIRTLTKSHYLRLSLFVITLVPLLYGVLYLWAFWDPYKNMENVPVAVVNNDLGASKDSKSYNFGDQVVDELKANTSFKWTFVSQSDADSGLDNKKYYAELIIPEKFSQDIISVDSDDAEQAVIEFKAREATNLLASQITNSAAKQLSASIGNEISKNYFENIFVRVTELSDGLQKAAKGSEELADGLSSAVVGSNALSIGAVSAYNGSTSLVKGINQLLVGSSSLADNMNIAYKSSVSLSLGLDALLSGGDSLKLGIDQALDGASQLNDGISWSATGSVALVSGSAQVKSGISQVDSGVTSLIDNLSATTSSLQTVKQLLSVPDANATITDTASSFCGMTYVQASSYIITQVLTKSTSSATQAQIQQLTLGISSLSTGDNQLDTGINDLSVALNSQIKDGSNQLVSGLNQISSGSSALNTGIANAKSGSESLGNGLLKLAQGSSSLNSGIVSAGVGGGDLLNGLSKLSNATSELATGITSASNGAADLNEALTEGVKQAAVSNDQSKTEKISEYMSNPVRLSDISIDKVSNYGTGFAPYFIPLALWVGSLIIFLIIKTNETVYAARVTRGSVNFAKYLVAASLGILQALVMDTVLILALRLVPAHPVLFYLFTCLASMSFVAILQFLVAILSDAGKFVGIVLLMLQLTSAAGTFPIETTPRFFQVINPYLPMTYVVAGLRELLSGNDMSAVAKYSLIVGACGFAFLILTIFFNRHIYRVDEKVLTNQDELEANSGIL